MIDILGNIIKNIVCEVKDIEKFASRTMVHKVDASFGTKIIQFYSFVEVQYLVEQTVFSVLPLSSRAKSFHRSHGSWIGIELQRCYGLPHSTFYSSKS